MTGKQNKLLNILDDYGWDVFSYDMISNEGSLSSEEIWEALRYLTKDGAITRIEKGKYHKTNFYDDNVIACSIVKDSCIAYWSAMNIHGLTEQFPNIIFVQNTKRVGELKLPNSGTRIKFIKVKENKQFGCKSNGYGNHIWRITDIEKTIVDSFDLPIYSGGFPEIIKAFNNAKLYQNKLIKYCKKVNNKSVTQRLGYLTELLEKPNMDDFIKYSQSLVGKNYLLFENGIPKSDETNARWKINLNISEIEILEIANSSTQW